MYKVLCIKYRVFRYLVKLLVILLKNELISMCFSKIQQTKQKHQNLLSSGVHEENYFIWYWVTIGFPKNYMLPCFLKQLNTSFSYMLSELSEFSKLSFWLDKNARLVNFEFSPQPISWHWSSFTPPSEIIGKPEVF